MLQLKPHIRQYLGPIVADAHVVLVPCMRPLHGPAGPTLNREMLYRKHDAVLLINDLAAFGLRCVLVLSGGRTSTTTMSEARLVANHIHSHGPRLASSVELILEENSTNTLENLVNARVILESLDLGELVVVHGVSNWWHVRFLTGGAYVFTTQRFLWTAHPAGGNRYTVGSGSDRLQEELAGIHPMIKALAMAGPDYRSAPQFYAKIRTPLARSAVHPNDRGIVAAANPGPE